METTSAPLLDRFIARAQSQPDWLNQDDKERLLQIIKKLQCVAICGDDEHRELWMTVERGPIEDFGDYEEFLEEGEVDNPEDFEQLWKDYYPDPVKWYLLSLNYYNGSYFIGMDNKLTLHLKDEPSAANESINAPFISWIDRMVDTYTDWLKKDADGYNQYIRQYLPFARRTGRIVRQQYWDIDPEAKEWMMKGLTTTDIHILKKIVEQSENEEKVVFRGKMTAGIFFDCCKMGYDANHYSYDPSLKPAEIYRKFSDGRDGGLHKLHPDSPQIFEEWFDKGEYRIGHPWEVCRGGNSTHISLYINKKDDGWMLSLAGKSRSRVAETVRFAIALYEHNIPFKLWDAKEILAMVTGTDYIGIVPEKVIPVYCHSYFPQEDHIIDFMNLPDEKRDQVIDTAYWYPLDEIKFCSG